MHVRPGKGGKGNSIDFSNDSSDTLLARFKLIEDNYLNFLNEQKLLRHILNDKNKSIDLRLKKLAFEEGMITYTSILIMYDRKCDAIDVL